jgi:hypothetical protein
MKKTALLGLALCAGILASTISTHAQTVVAGGTTNAPNSSSPQSIFQSAENFFVSFGPESFTNEHGFFESGAALQNNVNVGATLELGMPVYHPSANTAITLASETLNAGIAGTIVQEQVDVAWTLYVHDVKVLLGVGGGYDFQQHRAFPALFGELQKKLTANTHAFLRIEEPVLGKSATSPLVAAGVGFTF